MSGLVEPTRREPGNLAYHLHEQEDGRFFLYEVWRSREDLDRRTPCPRCAPSSVICPPSRRMRRRCTPTP
ncbi:MULTISPECIES: putative quinol monooxygenase [unclassified Streptomyces]|uniref:putative quinol monooxygenase n=1 Tax=unclassified Streptomyces TaxID=2593676 RepID=UPI001EF0D768|nr:MULTISPECIES: antibiotic biosynthesis monooxygenase [unclassified Streptomyces]